MHVIACAVCHRAVYDRDVDPQGRCCFCEAVPLTDSGDAARSDDSTIPPEEPRQHQPVPTSPLPREEV